MNQAQKKEKGLWASKLALLVTPRWLDWSVMLYWGEHGPGLPYMVIGNLCILSNVQQHHHWFNQLAVLTMRLHGTPTKYTCLSSTLYTSRLVLGGRRYHVIWLKLFLIHLEVHQLLKKQLQPFMNLRSWIMKNPIHQVFKHTFQIHSMCFQLPFHYGEPTHQERKRPGHRLAN